MSMTDKRKGRPQQDGPSLTDVSDVRSKVQRPGRTRPKARASVYQPDPDRAWWHMAYACPRCKRWHFGKQSLPIEDGPRVARCGRKVHLVVSRTYPKAAK